MRTLFLTIAVMLFSILSCPAVCRAATLIVDKYGDVGAFSDIQRAIDAASDGDIVLVRQDVYRITETINLNKNIVLRSEAGPTATIIRMRALERDFPAGSVVELSSSASVLEGFTLTGGTGSALGPGPIIPVGGGGVLCSGSPLITNCIITGNSADVGGGLIVGGGSSPTLTFCTISGNTSVWGGAFAVIDRTSSVTLENCIVWGNAPDAWGDESSLHASYSCIESDHVWSGLGNINEAPLFCGWPTRETAVQWDLEDAFDYSLALLEASPCIGAAINGTTMGADTGVCNEPGYQEHLIRLVPGAYQLVGFNLSHGLSIEGSGQDRTIIEGSLLGLRTGATVSNVSVLGGYVGGLAIPDGEAPRITGCSFRASEADGVHCGPKSSPILTNCEIAANGSYRTAGVYCERDATPELRNCRIIANSPRGWSWGGIYCDFGSAPRLYNCLLEGNYGSGIYCETGASFYLANCTIIGNLDYGINLHMSPSSISKAPFPPTVVNCIVNDNGFAPLPDGWRLRIQDESFIVVTSCIKDRNDGSVDPFGNMDADPRFVDPGHWTNEWVGAWTGGNYRLRPDSPCVDSGTSEGAPGTDFEGNGRPCGEGVDMGAYEAGDCPSSTIRFVRGNADGLGDTDIADAVFALTFLFLGGEEPPCRDAADADDTGIIDLTDSVYLLTYLFLGGPHPAEPFIECGIDPTLDDLDCVSFSPCPGP